MDKKKFAFCLDLIEQDLAQAMCCGIDEFLQRKLSEIFCKIESIRVSYEDVSK